MEKSKLSEYIDTEYSSGDSKIMQSKQKHREENNNEVDELSKEFTEMGCIVDPAKRPSNICIENCIYEESSGDEGHHEDENEDADGYSDEFEEEKSEDEELKLEPESAQSAKSNNIQSESGVKLIKSQSSMSSKPPASLSGRSTGCGSITVRPKRRVNMSFTNDRLREIERHNHILLNKILTARNERKSSIPSNEQPRKVAVPPAALQRRQLQKKIDHDNMAVPEAPPEFVVDMDCVFSESFSLPDSVSMLGNASTARSTPLAWNSDTGNVPECPVETVRPPTGAALSLPLPTPSRALLLPTPPPTGGMPPPTFAPAHAILSPTPPARSQNNMPPPSPSPSRAVPLSRSTRRRRCTPLPSTLDTARRHILEIEQARVETERGNMRSAADSAAATVRMAAAVEALVAAQLETAGAIRAAAAAIEAAAVAFTKAVQKKDVKKQLTDSVTYHREIDILMQDIFLQTVNNMPASA